MSGQRMLVYGQVLSGGRLLAAQWYIASPAPDGVWLVEGVGWGLRAIEVRALPAQPDLDASLPDAGAPLDLPAFLPRRAA